MAGSSRINSHRDLLRIDKTRGNITIENGDLLVKEKNVAWQTSAHRMVAGQNAPQEVPELLSGYVLAQREPTQPQNMIRQMSRATTLPFFENTHKRASTDHNTSINRLAEASASPKQPTTSAILKLASTDTKMFGEKSENFEVFENLFYTMLKKQPEMTKALKINHFHAHSRKEAIPTLQNINARNKRTLKDVIIVFRRRYVKLDHQQLLNTHGSSSLLTQIQNHFQIF